MNDEKIKFNVSLSKSVLDQIDEAAELRGLNRSSFISIACHDFLVFSSFRNIVSSDVALQYFKKVVDSSGKVN